jgi:hypothetical protein
VFPIALVTAEQFQQALKAIEYENWRLLTILLAMVVVWIVLTLIQLYLTKRVEAAIANRQHFGRLRYEREIEIYREAWKSLFDFHEASEKLLVGVPSQSPALKEWVGLRNNLVEVIRYNRPFYPAEIHRQLKAAQQLCEELKCIKEDAASLDDQGRAKLMSLPKRIETQMGHVEQAIRSRLGKFDAA